jgi:hypothetical protein
MEDKLPAITFYKENLIPVSFHSESKDFPLWASLRAMGYSDFELAVMDNFKSVIPLMVVAAKNKGMRLEVSDVEDDEIIRFDKDVMVFRGAAGKLLYNLFKGS